MVPAPLLSKEGTGVVAMLVYTPKPPQPLLGKEGSIGGIAEVLLVRPVTTKTDRLSRFRDGYGRSSGID